MSDTKERYDLIAPSFIEGMAGVLGYEPSDEHIKSVIMKDWYRFLQGDDVHPVTGHSRLHHMAVNLMRLDCSVVTGMFNETAEEIIPNDVGQFDAIMDLSFPSELDEVEKEFEIGLRSDVKYSGWKLYGFKQDARAVILNTNANEVIIAVSFEEFEDFFIKRQPR